MAFLLSNGHQLEYLVAAGALGYDGRGYWWDRILIVFRIIRPEMFTIVTKTFTRWPWQGNWRWWNPFYCFRFLRKGTVNAIGLSNIGIKRGLKRIASAIAKRKTKIIVSIAGNPKELAEMTRLLEDCPIVALEINASCPNISGRPLTAKEIIASCKAVAASTKLPLPILLKLSWINSDQLREILPAVAKIIQGISINSVPWDLVFPKRKSPLAHLGGGGVSGEIAQQWHWAFIKRLRIVMYYGGIDIPIIAPGVWRKEDIAKVRTLGAKAVSFGSLFLCHPWRPNRIVSQAR